MDLNERQRQMIRGMTGEPTDLTVQPGAQSQPMSNADQAEQDRRYQMALQNYIQSRQAPPEMQAPPQQMMPEEAPPQLNTRQFPKIHQSIQSGQPISANDIRSMTSPTQALSPEQEAGINKQLGGEDEEEDQASNDNNRAGSAEGNYR